MVTHNTVDMRSNVMRYSQFRAASRRSGGLVFLQFYPGGWEYLSELRQIGKARICGGVDQFAEGAKPSFLESGLATALLCCRLRQGWPTVVISRGDYSGGQHAELGLFNFTFLGHGLGHATSPAPFVRLGFDLPSAPPY